MMLSARSMFSLTERLQILCYGNVRKSKDGKRRCYINLWVRSVFVLGSLLKMAVNCLLHGK